MPYSPQEEFTHPVIQAMQQAFEQIQRAKSTKFNQDLNTRQADLAQKQFDEVKRQHDTEKDFQQKHLDIALQELQNSLRKQQLEQAQMLQEYQAKGGKAEKAPLNIPGMQNALGKVGPDISIPGAGNSYLPGTQIQYDPANYQSQEERLQQQLDALRKSTEVQHQVAEPFAIRAEDRLAKRESDKQARDFTKNLVIHNADKASVERVANMKDATDRYVAELNARTRLQLARQGIDSNDPAIDNYVNDMYIMGNFDKIPGSAKVQNAIRGSVPRNWTPLNKEDKASVEQINIIDNLLAKTLKLADVGSGFTGKVGVFTGLGEAGSINQEIEGMLGTLARGVGKEKGVLTNRDILRAKGLVNDIRQTKGGNMEKYQDLKDLLDSGYRNTLTKYPEDQLNHILVSRGVDPQRFAKKPQIPTPTPGGQSLADKYNY